MKIFGKKWLSMSVAAVAAVCAISLISGLVACGDEGTPSQPSAYDITAPAESEVYTVDGLPESAVTGEQVSFKVTLSEPEDSALHSVVVEPVFDASFVVEPSADGTYAFTMPDGPVKIIVDAEKYETVLSDGGVGFDADNATQLVVGATNGGYINDDNDYVEAWEYNINLAWFQTAALSHRSEATSSNQSVIPDSAIHIEGGDKGSSAYFNDAQVYIDTSKISAGSTWLKIYLQSNNTSSNNGTVCVKITVVDSVELETMPESVVIDFDGYAEEGDDILVRFYDGDYIENSTIDGQPAPRYIQVAGKVGADGKATFSFDYVAGHAYSINIYKGTSWYEGTVTNGSEAAKNTLVLGDGVGGGSTVTGFDQYVGGELSFVNPSSSLELKVKGTFQEINWG